MTMSELEQFTKTYVAAAKQAGTWTASTDNLLKLQDKIGKQITLDGSFQDKLPEMSGDELPLISGVAMNYHSARQLKNGSST